MMGKLFDHLTTDGKGVVSQMTWFNQNGVGGTFDLRLIKDGKLSALGEKYKTVCQTWSQANGFGENLAKKLCKLLIRWSKFERAASTLEPSKTASRMNLLTLDA